MKHLQEHVDEAIKHFQPELKKAQDNCPNNNFRLRYFPMLGIYLEIQVHDYEWKTFKYLGWHIPLAA